MPEPPDRRLSIRAEALVNTKSPRELTGIRHQQDPGHELHHRDSDGAHTPATHLLGRDGTQPAPTPRRNVSEAGVSDVLLRPDQPNCTPSNRLTSHPEMELKEDHHQKLADWAPANGPQEHPDVTTNVPAPQVPAATLGGKPETQESNGLGNTSTSKALGKVEFEFPAAAAPPAATDEHFQGHLSGLSDGSGLDGHHSVPLQTGLDDGEVTVLGNGDIEDPPGTFEEGRQGHSHTDACFVAISGATSNLAENAGKIDAGNDGDVTRPFQRVEGQKWQPLIICVMKRERHQLETCHDF